MTLISNSVAILEDAENISKHSGDWTFLDFVGINTIKTLFIGTEYDIKMNEHKESQMKEEHIRGQRNNLLEKIYEHKKESLERLTKLKQMLTEEDAEDDHVLGKHCRNA